MSLWETARNQFTQLASYLESPFLRPSRSRASNQDSVKDTFGKMKWR